MPDLVKRRTALAHVGQDLQMAVFGWIGKRLKKIPEGQAVYNNVQPIAEGVKAVVQIIIGLSSVVILITQLSIHLSESALRLGNLALAIIGVALAFSAVVELTYTFFLRMGQMKRLIRLFWAYHPLP